MKYIGLLSSAASGKLGGIVASHNRGGQYFRKHTVPTQPRTAAQSLVRAQLRALSSSFRSLTASQVAGWNALGATVSLKNKLGAVYHPTGAQLFVSCNKNLQLIGTSALLTDAPSIPTLPTVTTFTIAPIYTAGLMEGLTLSVTPALPATSAVILRASSVQSTGRTFLGKSQFRSLAGYNPATNLPTTVNSLYTDRFGPWAGSGYVGAELRIVDPNSGFAGPPVRAMTDYESTATYNLFTLAVGAQVGTTTSGSGTVTFTVTPTAENSFAGAVTYSVSGLPANCTFSFSKNPDAVTAAPTLSVIATSATAGTYTITVIGTYGEFSDQANATLTIA